VAELQWIVEVRCTNALLAEMKVGEKGEHVIINIPDRSFDPSEFDKLIEGLEVCGRIAEENRRSSRKSKAERASSPVAPAAAESAQILEDRDLYELKMLKTGEIVSINVPDNLFAPSEYERFVKLLKGTRSKMEELRRSSI
jgi:hypothetical protein